MKRFLLILVLSVVASVVAFPVSAQPSYLGGLFVASVSDGNDGNGPSVGARFDAAVDVGRRLKAVGYFSGSRDPKIPLGYAGLGVRAGAAGRYYLTERLFAQAGQHYARVTYNGVGGYTKAVYQSSVGGGVELGDVRRVSVVTDYQYHPRAALRSGNYIDGWSTSQQAGIKIVAPASATSRMVYLFEARYGRYAYQRNPSYYGEESGRTVHRSSVFQIGLGLGFKLPNSD